MRPPRARGRRLLQAFGGAAATELKIRVVLSTGFDGPPLPLRIELTDMVFVLKAKVECALRLLRETQGEGSVGRVAIAEDIELIYRGVPLRDMTSIDRYGMEHGADVRAVYMPKPSERDTVPREPDFDHLDALIQAEAGVPSTATLKRIISRRGKLCQVCWRSRWFRAEILSIYSTSILLGWHDWPEAEWPHFFVHVSLASSHGMPPGDSDETWRIRWHSTEPTRVLPIVMPRYRELPPMNWVKAFLRTYAMTDESQMLREIQASLPRKLVEARQREAKRHRCIVLGASGVGKSTLVNTICSGPPPSAAPTLGLDGIEALAGGGEVRPKTAAGGTQKYWPTVGTRSLHGLVHTPGLPPLQLEVWDTSGNPRFKPLSLVFYRQAHSVVLVFDVRSMESFRSLGAIGGWLHEFTRLTGYSPRNFPFVLVGNKAEEDVMHARQVYEEDVREWLYKEGMRMPYVETSFGGDPRTGWKHAERVFRTISRTAHRLKENLGRHRPPETVRVPEEPDASEDGTGSFDAGTFLLRTTGGGNTGLLRGVAMPDGLSKLLDATSAKGREVSSQVESLMREPLQRVAKASGEWLQCTQRNVDKAKAMLPLSENKARAPPEDAAAVHTGEARKGGGGGGGAAHKKFSIW
jgi:GTPase SAR1 family protein